MSIQNLNHRTLIDDGIDYIEFGDISKALKCFNTVLLYDDSNIEALFGRGVCHIKQGLEERGLDDIRMAASLGNEHAKEFISTQHDTIMHQPKKDNPGKTVIDPRNLYGIKGWLAFFCATLFLSSFVIGGEFTGDISTIDEEIKRIHLQYPKVTSILNENSAARNTLLQLETAKDIAESYSKFAFALLALATTSLVYIYKKIILGITLAKLYLTIAIFMQFIYPYYIYKSFELRFMDYLAVYGLQFFMFLSLKIAWLLYLYKSKRVKITFGMTM